MSLLLAQQRMIERLRSQLRRARYGAPLLLVIITLNTEAILTKCSFASL